MKPIVVQQFVPMTDAMLFGEAELPGPLVPYRFGVLCHHALERAELLRDAAFSDEVRTYRPV